VLIGRRAALRIAFDAMRKELSGALRRVHRSGKSSDGTGAAVAPPPHSAGPAKSGSGNGKSGSGRRQMGPNSGPISTSIE
jgi:hypothetical protein